MLPQQEFVEAELMIVREMGSLVKDSSDLHTPVSVLKWYAKVLGIKLEDCGFCNQNKLIEVKCKSDFFVRPLEQIDVLVIKAGKQGLVGVLNEKESNMLFPVRAMDIHELSQKVNSMLAELKSSFKQATIKTIKYNDGSGLMLDVFFRENKDVIHVNRWPLINVGDRTFQTLDYVMRMVDGVKGIGYVDKILYCLSVHNRTVGVKDEVSPFTSLYKLIDDRVWLRYNQRVVYRYIY